MHVLWGSKITAAATAAGAVVQVPAGQYALTVSGETVEVRIGTAIAEGQGTRLEARTQWVVGVPHDETWAVRSAGSTGVLELTRVA